MNEHSTNFHVMIDSKGRPTVRILPGIDTAPDVIFNKEQLAAELTRLFKQAASTGWQIGQREARQKMLDALGIERP